ARLRAALDARITLPGQAADWAATVPLRKPTTRRGTEDDGGQLPHRGGWVVRGSGKSDLGRQIAVDFQADANLDETRGRPRHGQFPLSFPSLFCVGFFLPFLAEPVSPARNVASLTEPPPSASRHDAAQHHIRVRMWFPVH